MRNSPKRWFFAFDNAPDFELLMIDNGRKLECALKSKEQPTHEETQHWIEAIWDRASHHGVEGQEMEFTFLNDLMEKLDSGWTVEI